MTHLTDAQIASLNLSDEQAKLSNASKKDVVDLAVREYIDNHRDEIGAGVRAALQQLDGTTKSAVSLLTGFSSTELEELGGLA